MGSKQRTFIIDGKLKCNRCGEKKLLTEYTKAAASPLGYKYTCTVCDYSREKKRRERICAQRKANPPVYSQEPVQCTKCGGVRPRSKFTPDIRKSNGLKSHCHTCCGGATKGQRAKWKVKNRANPPLQIGVQKCIKCKHLLSYKSFNRDSGEHNGFRKVCKECSKAPVRVACLKRNYGISREQYVEMHKQQGGVCKICGKPETAKRGQTTLELSVDHNHKTGKVRGLLCCNCNHALGTVKEDTKILKSAIKYLEEYDV